MNRCLLLLNYHLLSQGNAMEWFDPMTTLWAVVNQAIGYAICWFYGVRAAKRELRQLKSKARAKAQSIASKLEEAAELRRQLAISENHIAATRRSYRRTSSTAPFEPIRRTKE